MANLHQAKIEAPKHRGAILKLLIPGGETCHMTLLKRVMS